MVTYYGLADHLLSAQMALHSFPALTREQDRAKETCNGLADHLFSTQESNSQLPLLEEGAGQSNWNLLDSC